MPVDHKDFVRAGQGSTDAAVRIINEIGTADDDLAALIAAIQAKDLSIEVTDIAAEAGQAIVVSARFVDHAGDPVTGAKAVLVRATTARYGVGALAADITLTEVASQGTRGNAGASAAEYTWTAKADGTFKVSVLDDTATRNTAVYLEFLSPYGADFRIRSPAKAVCTFA